MGKSVTIHCIGRGADGLRYYAMNKVEIAQELHKAAKEGRQITSWYAQTKIGCRILGDEFAVHFPVPTTSLSLLKLVTCPVCTGQGCNGRYRCPVCAGSGICKLGNERKWQTWQIEDMKQRGKK